MTVCFAFFASRFLFLWPPIGPLCLLYGSKALQVPLLARRAAVLPTQLHYDTETALEERPSREYEDWATGGAPRWSGDRVIPRSLDRVEDRPLSQFQNSPADWRAGEPFLLHCE